MEQLLPKLIHFSMNFFLISFQWAVENGWPNKGYRFNQATMSCRASYMETDTWWGLKRHWKMEATMWPGHSDWKIKSFAYFDSRNSSGYAIVAITDVTAKSGDDIIFSPLTNTRHRTPILYLIQSTPASAHSSKYGINKWINETLIF